MDFEEFDVIKSEKFKAIRRYLRVRKLGTLIRIAEALCALFFFGYYFSNISFTVDVVSGFLRRQLRVLTTPFSAFVFGNGIVLIIFVLSDRGKDCDVGVDGDSEGNAVFHKVCEEYESHQKSSHLAAEDSPEETGVEKPMVFSLGPEEVKEITTVTVVFVDVNEIPEDAKVKSTKTESNIQPWKDEICMPISGDGEGKANGPIPSTEESVNKGLLRRSNSEVIAAKRPTMTGMRKWDTDNGRSITLPIGDGTSPRPSSVDDLSDEEFNLKVERYIASQKLMLWEEMLAEQSARYWREIESSGLANNND